MKVFVALVAGAVAGLAAGIWLMLQPAIATRVAALTGSGETVEIEVESARPPADEPRKRGKRRRSRRHSRASDSAREIPELEDEEPMPKINVENFPEPQQVEGESDVHTILSRNQHVLHPCLTAIATHLPDFQGEIRLTFNVWIDGGVRNVKVHGLQQGTADLQLCFEKALAKIPFGGGRTQSEYVSIPYTITSQ